MKNHSYESMLNEYDNLNIKLDLEDVNERKKMISEQRSSLIIEGAWIEFENVEKWIVNNLSEPAINIISYGKTGYDFGFMEYFFDKEEDKKRLENEIPNIYTLYPNGSYEKSDGYENAIKFKQED
jgi:hypothetical protein